MESIYQLIEIKTETKNLDYKEDLNWDKSSNDKKLETVKDIIAMANTQDGGKIVIGVRDDDYEFVGLSEEDYKSFDQTKLNEFLHKYTDPKFSCQVYKDKIYEKYVVVIDIPEFQEVPIICKRDAHSSKNNSKQILQKGQIYIRTDKATSEVIPSAQEMRELLGRAIVKKGDELLNNIEHLIKGKPLKTTEDSEEKYKIEIKETNDYLSRVLGEELKKYGYWEVYVYPTDYVAKRIAELKKIKELIEKSEVGLGGWHFPDTDNGNASNFTKCRQAYTIWNKYIEGYRAYQSGLFVWKRAIWEDIEGRNSNGKPVLSFINAIYSITEFFLFFKRYYEEISPDSDLHIEVILNGTKDRKLIALDPSDSLEDWYIAKEDLIRIQEDIKVVDLRASYKEIANRVIRDIFTVFNWDNVSEEVIDKLQTKLIERKI